MSGVFIIGLPVPLRRRIEAAAKQRGMTLSSVLADVASRGTLRLLPYPGQAVHDLRKYLDSLPTYEDADVIVLPYAKLPDELEAELDALEELGGSVDQIRYGAHGWKKLEKPRPDEAFLNHVFQQLTDLLFPGDDDPPSEYFQNLAARCSQIILPVGVLATCDAVAAHRYKFMRGVADALERYVLNGGAGGRIDAFFGELGLDHAQTGGINATLEIYRNGECIRKQTCNTHLKQGDHTTPSAAARVYYQAFTLDGRLYVAVLYAGPHPEADVSWSVDWG